MTNLGALEPSLSSTSVELLDDNDSVHVRSKVLALRQRKRAELLAAAGLGIKDALPASLNRFTWVGVDELTEQPEAFASSTRTACLPDSRGSDEDTDNDSTILGHIQQLPLPPRQSTPDHHARQRSRPSFASEDAASSSQDSGSLSRRLLEDDDDAHSLHTTSATETSSGPPSRRGSGAPANVPSHRRSKHNSGKDSSKSGPSSLATSRPLGPPPSLPLPPKPLSSPHARSPSATQEDFWPSRRSSHASTKTADSSRSSASGRSSWKSNYPNLASSPLLPTPSDRSNTSDLSEDELISIRGISKQFPSPTSALGAPPTSSLHPHRRNSSRASNRSESSAGGSRMHRKVLSTILDTASDHPVETDPVRGEDSSDGALSDVLDLADNKGTLRTRKPNRKAFLPPSVAVARVGLGAPILLRRSSEQSLRSPNTTRATKSPGSEQAGTRRDAKGEREHVATRPAERPNHQRSASMSRSMSELMAALDLEASEWGQRVGGSDIAEPSTRSGGTTQRRESHVLDGQLRRPSIDQDCSGAVQPQLPNSDSIPTLSPSGSQEVSLDDSRGPATAESSLIRSDSAKTIPSLAGSKDIVTETADGDFNSIYNAYRFSASTVASRLTAPVLRIEDPQGDEVSDSELERDAATADDVPRKRTKPSRKKSLGFEEQRAALRSRPSLAQRSASLSSKPSRSFLSTLVPTEEEEDGSTSDDAPPSTAGDGADPYAFYEFSPSLPPFMPAGVSPMDLTGRGTWSSIVARASDNMRSRQPSVVSLASTATTATGPMSMREIRANAHAKQRQADAAHRAREQMSSQFASMSYRPFAIHDHAASVIAGQARMSIDNQSFFLSNMGSGSPIEDAVSGRSTSMSSISYTSTLSPDLGEYGTRWPVAIGADQSVGPEDAASIFTTNPWSLSRSPSSAQPQPRMYAEFSMQTSPQASPTEPTFAISDSLTVDDELHRTDVQVGSEARLGPAASSGLQVAYRGVDVPLRRRKSAASILSAHNLDAELDQPGLWPSQIRAPRLSSYSRRRSDDGDFAAAAPSHETDSDEESDLDVNANLEDLAERSGMLEVSRGAKRKVPSVAIESQGKASGDSSMDRVIASIPARSRRISAALDRIRAQRVSRSAGWAGSDDEGDSESSIVPSLPRRTSSLKRRALSKGASVKSNDNVSVALYPESSSPVSVSKGAASSPLSLRVRSPSPDLSILTHASDDEEILLTSHVDLDTGDLSHQAILDDEFDMMVGQSITSRFSRSKPGFSPAMMRRASNESGSAEKQTSPKASGGVSGDAEHSSDSQETVHQRSGSRPASRSSVLDILEQADELLSSTDHTIGHSTGHDTIISDTGGTIGHGGRKEGLMAGRVSPKLVSTSAVDVTTRLPHYKDDNDRDQAMTADDTSARAQDTPDTRAGSEIWTSFHLDRSSNASTTSTWSHPSGDDSPSTTLPKINELAPQSAPAAVDSASKSPSMVQQPAVRASPVLRRKSSALPVPTARSSLQKPSRPSLPLPAKSATPPFAQADSSASQSGASATKLAMRRNQSLANLRPLTLTSKSTSDATPLKDASAARNARLPARYSEGFYTSTPSKAIRSVGGGIAPSKLPSLRATASTTSLRARAVADSLPVPNGVRRSRLPSPGAVRASGLPRPSLT
ncbi:hypothetical protein PSEUBRA_001143 [Kalmanozyma brasiliensis GHG001]|uniref:uncharacterized protein n=1 Tax=Kalmanozyma brasiliensis (strain GHG001) TaxID=1365824 RepID=UPI0028681445|nr:uncharacterized protein PSEUBRA_001143 [Kalmanozyma brasiliensis GHG001]KAF6766895.1 hypothetical protein PSEUBRA_001143 [Kalmanozyma brasiliensis GHG001]